MASRNNLAAVEQAFHTHYTGMHRYAYTLLRDQEAAREAVQQVFTRLLENADRLEIKTSLQGYLYKSLYHHCVNRMTRERPRVPIQDGDDLSLSADWLVECRELQTRIREVVAELPPGCREIFLKSREEQKSYAQIAAENGISVKTVEAQVGKALRILRERLEAYGVILCLFIYLFVYAG
ncbi:RNA polymerase sigma-70 factor (ECF subfamily) [Dinghuibacter silviterrae]|uniref:RNA polymerase sigma-70 factor (ECF subfamily) n=1 Tax=Dinghuibacter silviterrae TaxID=1539049 RepID=A0A4R8DWC2_9BACT|nr:RNA polymerase sigma-70 factor (ECF subfamily) [Dinghuibacter silviterrae]